MTLLCLRIKRLVTTGSNFRVSGTVSLVTETDTPFYITTITKKTRDLLEIQRTIHHSKA